MAQPLRGALIGAGAISTYHLSAWGHVPQAEIVAICDPNRSHAAARAAEFGLAPGAVFTDAAQMFRRLALDFVDITAPPEVHPELTELAAAHRAHVNCQKPFALSLPEARRMISACQSAEVTLNINENWRWRAWYRTIRQMIQAGKIGQPVYFRVFTHSSGYAPGATKLRRIFDWKCIILLEIGVHQVDILRFLFGEPTHVTARTQNVSGLLQGEDRAIVLLDFPGPLHALLDMSWASHAPAGYADRETHPIEDCRIEGTHGAIELVRDPLKGDLIRLTTASETSVQPAYPDRTPAEAYLDSYIAAQRHFIECLQNGVAPETAANDNLHTLATILAAYRSAETLQTVSIAEFIQSV